MIYRCITVLIKKSGMVILTDAPLKRVASKANENIAQIPNSIVLPLFIEIANKVAGTNTLACTNKTKAIIPNR